MMEKDTEPSPVVKSDPPQTNLKRTCEPCTAAKVKCDGNMPCSRCHRRYEERFCVYRAQKKRGRRVQLPASQKNAAKVAKVESSSDTPQQPPPAKLPSPQFYSAGLGTSNGSSFGHPLQTHHHRQQQVRSTPSARHHQPLHGILGGVSSASSSSSSSPNYTSPPPPPGSFVGMMPPSASSASTGQGASGTHGMYEGKDLVTQTLFNSNHLRKLLAMSQSTGLLATPALSMLSHQDLSNVLANRDLSNILLQQTTSSSCLPTPINSNSAPVSPSPHTNNASSDTGVNGFGNSNGNGSSTTLGNSSSALGNRSSTLGNPSIGGGGDPALSRAGLASLKSSMSNGDYICLRAFLVQFKSKLRMPDTIMKTLMNDLENLKVILVSKKDPQALSLLLQWMHTTGLSACSSTTLFNAAASESQASSPSHSPRPAAGSPTNDRANFETPHQSPTLQPQNAHPANQLPRPAVSGQIHPKQIVHPVDVINLKSNLGFDEGTILEQFLGDGATHPGISIHQQIFSDRPNRQQIVANQAFETVFGRSELLEALGSSTYWLLPFGGDVLGRLLADEQQDDLLHYLETVVGKHTHTSLPSGPASPVVATFVFNMSVKKTGNVEATTNGNPHEKPKRVRACLVKCVSVFQDLDNMHTHLSFEFRGDAPMSKQNGRNDPKSMDSMKMQSYLANPSPPIWRGDQPAPKVPLQGDHMAKLGWFASALQWALPQITVTPASTPTALNGRGYDQFLFSGLGQARPPSQTGSTSPVGGYSPPLHM